VFKSVKKIIFMNSSLFFFLIINVEILFNFQKEWWTSSTKKWCLKKTRIVHSRGWSAWNMHKKIKIVSSSEHVNFAINWKYCKNFNDNPNFDVSLMIFQTYKM
jgi:hypothetical protein